MCNLVGRRVPVVRLTATIDDLFDPDDVIAGTIISINLNVGITLAFIEWVQRGRARPC